MNTIEICDSLGAYSTCVEVLLMNTVKVQSELASVHAELI